SLTINRNDPSAATSYASLVCQLGNVNDGIEILQNVLVEHPQSARTWMTLGSAFRTQGNYADAILALRRAQALAPRQFEVLFALAGVLFLQVKLNEAEQLVRQLLIDNPQACEAWKLLSAVLD